MPVISCHDVSKDFAESGRANLKDAVLRRRSSSSRQSVNSAITGLTFSIEEGETVALLGHNGSGKSTVLKMIAGVIRPSRGRVDVRGSIAPLLELGSGFHADLTGRENVFLNAALLGVSRSYVRQHLDEIVEFSGLGEHIDAPVRVYSSGMYARLGFAIAMHVQPDIILADEVLAVGDAGFQRKCLDRMSRLQSEGRTILLVTQSLQQALGFCKRAMILKHGNLIFDGETSAAETAFIESSQSAL